MRNEYATAPYLAPIADLLPRIVFADFTRQLLGRDYLVESLLPGTPLPEAVGPKAGPRHAPVFERIGDVARRIHTVPGPGFGRVIGPLYDTWSEALVTYFRAAADDVHDTGHDADDIRDLADETERLAPVLDEITRPRLLHGDGWTGNFLLDADLTVTGVLDWDRAEWGDPLADWAIQRALRKPGTVREAFWVGYGRPRTVATGVRQDVYRARFLLGCRLDMIRPGGGFGSPEDVAANYRELGETLDLLRKHR
jgi:aminoglycoside phosphotransferase (APT) family kinase protein